MKDFKMDNCVVCGKEIYRNKNPNSTKTRRSVKSVTCSKKCSRIYLRVSQYIKNNRK